MFNFHLLTLGCKANQYESAAISQALCLQGGSPWQEPLARASQENLTPAGADLVVINTCCVTTSAMQKSRYFVRRSLLRHKNAVFLITGCYSDLAQDRLRTLLHSLGLPPHRFVIAGHHDDLPHAITQALARLGESVPGATGVSPVESANSGAMLPSESMPPANAVPLNDISGKFVPPSSSTLLAGAEVSQSQPQTRLPQFVPPSSSTLLGGADVAQTVSLRERRLTAIHRQHPGTRTLPQIQTFPSHQRAYVKIQDGCDAFCSYCIVPYTRPVIWSRPSADVLHEARQLIAAGHKEIILGGIFLGAFGRPSAIRRTWTMPSPLPDLIRQIAQIPGLWKVRLSSLEPLDADDALLNACQTAQTFAPHFHLPLQSGSARILKRMNRQYTPQQFRDAVSRIRDRFDNPAFTTDIIVGFPGETDDDFAQTLDVARFAAFSDIHIFPFSPIEGTAAWRHRHDSAPPHILRQRLVELSKLQQDLAASYNQQFIGQTVQAVVEEPNEENAQASPPPPAAASSLLPAASSSPLLPVASCLLPASPNRIAMTDRHLTVSFQADTPAGTLVNLRITAASPAGLAGTLD